jgi:hypothetical protein
MRSKKIIATLIFVVIALAGNVYSYNERSATLYASTIDVQVVTNNHITPYFKQCAVLRSNAFGSYSLFLDLTSSAHQQLFQLILKAIELNKQVAVYWDLDNTPVGTSWAAITAVTMCK